VQLVADDSTAIARGMGEDAANDLGLASIRPDENLSHLAPDARGIRPAINRLVQELKFLCPRHVAVDGKAGRIVRVQFQQPLALRPRRLIRMCSCCPAAASTRITIVAPFMEPPVPDWTMKKLNSDADRLRIKSYDYKYRRCAAVVNEILRKFVRHRSQSRNPIWTMSPHFGKLRYHFRNPII
jgi:hypothetical protein